MRILMISDVYFPRVNGVSTSIQTFRSEFIAAGHKVTLIVPDYDGDNSADEPDIIRIPSRRLPMDPEDRRMSHREIKRLVWYLGEQNYDIVHIQTPFIAHYSGLKIARELGLPVVETYHTFFEEYLFNYIKWLPRGMLRSLARSFSRSQCNKVNSVFVPSKPMFDVLRRYGVQRHMQVIPTGIDLEELSGGRGDRFRQKHGIDADRKVMIYVGRLAHEKNIHFLLDVLDQVRFVIPGALLILAGEGPARESLAAQAADMGLMDHVLFVGYLQRGDELNDCYRAGDLFVFASRTETQGLVLLEAMALGLPVVSTAVMGTKDVLQDGAGCRIAEDHPTRFADHVIDILTDSDLCTDLKRSGYGYARKWNSQIMADRMLKAYGAIITRVNLQESATKHSSRVRRKQVPPPDSRTG